ncbi:hypothetical protein EIP91_003831 [Steccherinum ochraceum]|uniref:Cytochrome P450 n=1 Tax=Steccherinum ochraceum TaxID=92696 RepID=A0A4R0RIA2_9APHY|nr:hypothetical protein EIP91_003831 [Steccherinum ochraceum]
MSSAHVLLISVCAVIFYCGYQAVKTRQGSLPPGPPGWPIAGNVLDLPRTFLWLKYREWSKQYGVDLQCTPYPLPTDMIVVSSPKIVSDLLEKRAAIYSDRPKLVMAIDLIGWDRVTVLMPPNAVWKEHRRSYAKLFGSKAATAKFASMEVTEAKTLMKNILDRPDELRAHIKHWAASLSLKIAYGYETKPGHDNMVTLINLALRQFAQVQKLGSFMVDVLPWLQYIPAWFPGAGFQTVAHKYRQTLTDAIDTPYHLVKDQVAAGTAKPSFTTDLLNADDYTTDKDFAVKTSASTIYAAGSDTSAGQLYGLTLDLMLNPEARKKAQGELERVVGFDRLPEYADRENLPYLEACVTEAFRLHTLAPLGGTRAAAKDDVYEGYFIPKGTVIQPNIWQMVHDPEVYDRPMEYIPERWLTDNPPPHPRELSFGFGRRICPGSILAEASVWITTAMFLALFDISPTEGSPTSFDQSDKGILDGSTLCHPLEFKCAIRPRSNKAKSLISSFESET